MERTCLIENSSKGAIDCMTLSSRYRQLMDLANQASDRQSYFHYLREAQSLLSADRSGQSGVHALNQFLADQLATRSAA